MRDFKKLYQTAFSRIPGCGEMPLLEADVTSSQRCLQLFVTAFLPEVTGSVSYQRRDYVSTPQSALWKVSQGGLMCQ